MSPLEAASRRDFTINSMMQNVLTGEIIDPFNGIQDLNDHRLSITSEAFREDPLRVLRGFQFCSRFSLTPDLKTIQTCRLMIDEFDELPIERVWVEWEKWALKAVSPAHGLRFLLSSGWITKFRELNALRVHNKILNGILKVTFGPTLVWLSRKLFGSVNVKISLDFSV